VVPEGAKDMTAAADTTLMQRLRRKGDVTAQAPQVCAPRRETGSHKDIVVNLALCGGFSKFCFDDNYGL